MSRRAIVCGLGAAACLPLTARAAKPVVDARALSDLLVRARRTRSDALVVYKNGGLVIDLHERDGPIETMSITKSIASLAAGLLVDDGKLALDDPLSHLYPEWRNGPKAAITLRHVLNHTTGLQPETSFEKIAAAGDGVKSALDAPAVGTPGMFYAYDHRAFNLVPDIVERSAGKPIEVFLGERIFTPLGVWGYRWLSDRAGRRWGMYGLQMRGKDLAQVGQLIASGGTWRRKALIGKHWIATALTPQSSLNRDIGLFWYLQYDRRDRIVDDEDIARWHAAGVTPALVDKVAALRGRLFNQVDYEKALYAQLGADGFEAWRKALRAAHTSGASIVWGRVDGFSAKGELGQYLIVYPEKNLVVVRLIREASHAEDADDFIDVYSHAAALAGVPPG